MNSLYIYIRLDNKIVTWNITTPTSNLQKQIFSRLFVMPSSADRGAVFDALALDRMALTQTVRISNTIK